MTLRGAEFRTRASGPFGKARQVWRLRASIAAFVLSPLALISGCTGLVKANGATTDPAVQLTPASLNFGSTVVGKKVSQIVSVTNTGNVSVNISQATVSNNAFSVSGLTLPLVLPIGQMASFQVSFNASSAGNATGTLTVRTDTGVSSAQVALAGTATAPQQQISVTPANMNLGSVAVGTTATSQVTLSNVGGANLTISLISVNGAPFGVSGISTPTTIAPGASTSMNVTFSPTLAGISSGSVSITSNDPQTPTSTIPLTGTGAATAAPTITTQPGNVTVTAGQAATFAVVASGTAPLSYQWQKNGGNIAGATAASYTTPATTSGDSGSSFAVVVSNTAGSVTSSAATLTVNAAPVAPTITTQPGNVTVTAGQTATFAVVASGTAPLSYQWQKNGGNIVGATAASYTTPATTSGDSGSTFQVVVSNTAGSVTSSAATLTVNAPGIQVSPGSVTFGNDVVGTNSSQPLIITNSGTATLTITQVNETGPAFSVTGFSLPMSVSAGKQTTMTVAFQPTAVGTTSGNISIVSNAPTSPTSVGLTGTGIAATFTLGISPTSLNFGNVTTGTTTPPQVVTITNTGNSNITISQITLSGPGYSLTGGSVPVTLSPSQNLTLTVQFSPTAVGTANRSLSIVSNASGSPATVSLSGTGVAPVQHSVALTWNASSSSVVGYNVYRSTVSGSSYIKINPSVVSTLAYTDSTVQSSTTYYYVTTAIDSSGNESVYSNEVSATIP